MDERRKELNNMTVFGFGGLDELARKYKIEVDHMRKSEIVEAILNHEMKDTKPVKKTRPPRNFAPTKLKALRIAAGLTQKELAERSGIKEGTLKHYEQGSKCFDLARLDVIIKVCCALGCKFEDIIENEETKELYLNVK